MGLIPPHIFIAFDSCGFLPPIKSEKLAAEKLLNLIEKHQIQFSIPQAVLEETERAPNRIREMAHKYIFDYDMFTTVKEQRELLEVQELLFGITEGLSRGKINDARNLLCAKKYGCTYFVTFDRNHILSNGEEIKSKLGFEVIIPSECLEKLQDYLQ